MFKKPIGQLKTSAPIRASDRRKLKQRVISTFSTLQEHGDLLIPDGILTAKFFTYAKEPGTLYLDPGNGNPLWFTIGKGSEDLIPTVYTLWKLQDSNLLPYVFTPSAVIPILVGGADLMIPGVITHIPSTLDQGQLVAVHQLSGAKNDDGTMTRLVSPPLAVGRMAISSEGLKARREADEKGKAVLVLHTWKDHLWEVGQKGDVPPSTPLGANDQAEGGDEGEVKDEEEKAEENEGDVGAQDEEPDEEDAADSTPKITYTPEEISDLLTRSLIHAIATQLTSPPKDTFPIPSTQLYQTYILPSRPAYPTSILSPSSAPVDSEDIHIDPSEITIKASTHKSVSTFLKAVGGASFLTLKYTKQKSGGSDYVVTSVNVEHPDVVAYATGKDVKRHVTVADIEAKKAKRLAREEREERERERSEREVEVRQVWKPWLGSIGLFEDMGANTSAVYTLNNIRILLNDYFVSQQLINPRDQAYINLNRPLLACLAAKSSVEPGKKVSKSGAEPSAEFMKRDELMKRIVEHMQSWYEVKAEGKDIITTKGEIKPIRVEVKYKMGGRRGITAITGFEPFMVIDAEEMAEKIRKICAGSTSVSPYQVPGTNQQRLKVVVQGKQSKAVVDYLIEKGIPKKWITVAEMVGKK